MSKKAKVSDTLKEYFKEKGRILTPREYRDAEDTPIRYQQVMNIFVTWGRMEKIIMARRETSEPITDINEVLAARNKAQLDFENQWKESSENLHAKMIREAEAQVVAEKLTKNAATPEGANANKLAIGGPLPGEQAKFETLGATVNIDSVTGERTVVDPEPELFDGTSTEEEGVGMTPAQLKTTVEAKDADVKVGKSTSGGTDGSPSIATAAAGSAPAKTSAKK